MWSGYQPYAVTTSVAASGCSESNSDGASPSGGLLRTLQEGIETSEEGGRMNVFHLVQKILFPPGLQGYSHLV